YSDSAVHSMHLLTSINHAWAILDKYYALADRLPVLYAAVALDPDTKLKYFEIEWKDHPEWIVLAMMKSKELW
ncbi:hypothetical protein L873DRAFT_1637140, partial [Choiromyces venosus 120613-1]